MFFFVYTRGRKSGDYDVWRDPNAGLLGFKYLQMSIVTDTNAKKNGGGKPLILENWKMISQLLSFISILDRIRATARPTERRRWRQAIDDDGGPRPSQSTKRRQATDGVAGGITDQANTYQVRTVQAYRGYAYGRNSGCQPPNCKNIFHVPLIVRIYPGSAGSCAGRFPCRLYICVRFIKDRPLSYTQSAFVYKGQIDRL